MNAIIQCLAAEASSVMIWHNIEILKKFANNTQQYANEFLIAILPVLQLPGQWVSVSSILKCKMIPEM